jgi:hydrogenase expression/formation protein HypE
MKVGKVPPEILRQYIFGNLGKTRSDVLVHSSLGEDCSVIDFGDEVCVLSTDPITGAVQDIGRLAVHISCNDIAANGAEPVGIMVTILAPVGTRAEDLGRIMGQINEEACLLGIEVLGGHSEITAGIDRVIISSTAVGRAKKDQYVTSSGALPGHALVITKGAGLEGTAILATDFADRLKDTLTEEQIQTARSFLDKISVVADGRIAIRNGAVAMHDVTEGGILGAAFEMAAASGTGVEIWEDAVIIHPVTRAICSYFDIDPLALVSSGAMMIAAPDGEKLVEALEKEGIVAAIIGRFINEGFCLVRNGKSRPVKPPERDEIWKIFAE